MWAAWRRPRRSDLPFLREPERVQSCHRLWLPGPLSPVPLLSMPGPFLFLRTRLSPPPECRSRWRCHVKRWAAPLCSGRVRHAAQPVPGLWGQQRCRAGGSAAHPAGEWSELGTIPKLKLVVCCWGQIAPRTGVRQPYRGAVFLGTSGECRVIVSPVRWILYG